MATVTEMRRVLRDAGEDVPERGRLTPEWVARYEAIAPSDPDWDIREGGDIAEPDEPAEPVPVRPETPPRSPRARRAERRAEPVGQRTGRIIRAISGSPASGSGATYSCVRMVRMTLSTSRESLGELKIRKLNFDPLSRRAKTSGAGAASISATTFSCSVPGAIEISAPVRCWMAVSTSESVALSA